MVMSPDEAFDAGRLVCASLDDTMTRYGFAPGQVGSRPGEAGVVFCSEHRAFRDRFPTLAPAIDHASPGACTDLNVYVTLREAGAHLAEVHLDGNGLTDLVRDVDGDDLEPDVAELAHLDLPQALGRLDHLLQEIFQRAAPEGRG